jgi:hypothetical protein
MKKRELKEAETKWRITIRSSMLKKKGEVDEDVSFRSIVRDYFNLALNNDGRKSAHEFTLSFPM